MSIEHVFEKTLEYFDNEYKEFLGFINRQIEAPSKPSRESEFKLIDFTRKCTIDRGMGVVMFVQSLGVKFDDIKSSYDDFKRSIDELTNKSKEKIDV